MSLARPWPSSLSESSSVVLSGGLDRAVGRGASNGGTRSAVLVLLEMDFCLGLSIKGSFGLFETIRSVIYHVLPLRHQSPTWRSSSQRRTAGSDTVCS